MKKILFILILFYSNLSFSQTIVTQKYEYTQNQKFDKSINVGDSAVIKILVPPRINYLPSIFTTRPGSIINYKDSAFLTLKNGVWMPLIGYSAENILNKGVPYGYPSLDVNGKIPTSQLNPIPLGYTYIESSLSAMLALSGAAVGDLCKRTDSVKTYILRSLPPSSYGNWVLISSSLELDPIWIADSSNYYVKAYVDALLNYKTNKSLKINGYSLNSNFNI